MSQLPLCYYCHLFNSGSSWTPRLFFGVGSAIFSTISLSLYYNRSSLVGHFHPLLTSDIELIKTLSFIATTPGYDLDSYWNKTKLAFSTIIFIFISVAFVSLELSLFGMCTMGWIYVGFLIFQYFPFRIFFLFGDLAKHQKMLQPVVFLGLIAHYFQELRTKKKNFLKWAWYFFFTEPYSWLFVGGLPPNRPIFNSSFFFFGQYSWWASGSPLDADLVLSFRSRIDFGIP